MQSAKSSIVTPHIGVGLWGMRSNVYCPSPPSRLYSELRSDAQLAEELGFDSLWLSEHHGWYDGWCPQPLVAASAALAATTKLRVGTAMYLLPQRAIATTLRDLESLLTLHGPRLELGVGLGYRDEEYLAVGVLRARRGALMDAYLDRLLAEYPGTGLMPVPIWVGGLAERAIRRAGRHGVSLLLPNTLRREELAARIQIMREEAAAAGVPTGQVGLLVDVWTVPGGDKTRVQGIRDRLAIHYREYLGAFFLLKGEPGFRRPDLLDLQSERVRASAIIGDAEDVAAELLNLREIGIDAFVLQIRTDALPSGYRRVMNDISRIVLPLVRD